MNIEVYYICPKVQPEIYFPLYQKFDASLRAKSGQNVKILHPDGTNGKDIGSYIEASKTCTADIMVCLGSHVRINHPEWLARIAYVWQAARDGLYGPFATDEPTPHIRTTAFWCSPALLRSYPWPVITDQDRYNFELSPDRSISVWAASKKLSVQQVTMTRVNDCFSFNPAVERSDCMMLDRFTDMQEAARK